jgi:hypothetical protein
MVTRYKCVVYRITKKYVFLHSVLMTIIITVIWSTGLLYDHVWEQWIHEWHCFLFLWIIFIATYTELAESFRVFSFFEKKDIYFVRRGKIIKCSWSSLCEKKWEIKLLDSYKVILNIIHCILFDILIG